MSHKIWVSERLKSTTQIQPFGTHHKPSVKAISEWNPFEDTSSATLTLPYCSLLSGSTLVIASTDFLTPRKSSPKYQILI